MKDYRHDIEKYLKGELTPAERNALERKALHDPFLADALEGAEQTITTDFLNDVSELNERIASKKYTPVWMWPARIAAGLALIAVSSFIVWTFLKPVPSQDLAFKESKPEATTSKSADSISTSTESLSSPSVEQPHSGPSVRDKDVATRSTYPLKTEAKPLQTESGESVLKNEPVTEPVITKGDVAKEEDISVTEPSAQAQSVEKEAEVSRAKDDTQDRKAAYKKKAAVPSSADKSGAVLDSFLQRVVRGKVTSAEDGSALPGVNVIIKGSTLGTSTGADGTYQIAIPNDKDVLTYSFIGLLAKDVNISNSENMDVQLQIDPSQLSEVVVTAFGIPNESKALGYSISKSSEDVIPLDLAHPEIGYKSFKQYLESNIRYPNQAKMNKVSGRVTVQFTVEANGSLTNFIILHGIGSGCDEELIRLIKEGPRWIPTKKDNIPVQDRAKVRLKF